MCGAKKLFGRGGFTNRRAVSQSFSPAAPSKWPDRRITDEKLTDRLKDGKTVWFI
jgi:hypothetical protein